MGHIIQTNFYFPTNKEFVFWLLVGLSAGLQENLWTDVNKTWLEDGSKPRVDFVNFIKPL